MDYPRPPRVEPTSKRIRVVHPGTVVADSTRALCEWKGTASYYDGWVAFYPGVLDECTVDGEPVRPQPNPYYGGWLTDDIVGL